MCQAKRKAEGILCVFPSIFVMHGAKAAGKIGRFPFVLRIKNNYSCLAAFIFTPGPMAEAATQERIYWPLAAAGLALMMAPMRAV